jgi:hypothetical protein
VVKLSRLEMPTTCGKPLRALSLALAALAAFACVDGSIPPRPKDDAGDHSAAEHVSSDSGTAEKTNSCPPSKETNACFKCTDENCCDEYAACHDDPRCGTYYKTCLPQCAAQGKDSSTCVVECASDNGAGHAKFTPYFACTELHCLARCAKDQVADPCVQCMYGSCRDEAYACDADSECDLLHACMTNCLSRPDYDACTATCTRTVDDGVKRKFDARNTCGLTYCQQACAPKGSADAGDASSNPTTAAQACANGAKTIYACCQMAGGNCDTQDGYERCCLGETCVAGGAVSKQIACLAGEHATDVEACANAFDTCGVGSAN